jgi:hypothetical protein
MVQLSMVYELMKRELKSRWEMLGFRFWVGEASGIGLGSFWGAKDNFFGGFGLRVLSGVVLEVWRGEKKSSLDVFIMGVIWRKFN